MTKFKTETAKIERVDYLISECIRIGEAMQAISDMADNVDMDDWTDADWKKIINIMRQTHEALSAANGRN